MKKKIRGARELRDTLVGACENTGGWRQNEREGCAEVQMHAEVGRRRERGQ